MKAVKVEWIDSCSSNQNWILMEELNGDVEPIKITTYGVLIQETDTCYTIAQNYGVEPEQVCNFMTIPKGCVTKITELK